MILISFNIWYSYIRNTENALVIFTLLYHLHWLPTYPCTLSLSWLSVCSLFSGVLHWYFTCSYSILFPIIPLQFFCSYRSHPPFTEAHFPTILL
jgi:hypothetical protein